ncbi:MAG: metal ABC transporter permease [Oscillospiraceae bacterium]
MATFFGELFSYSFLVRAFVVGTLVSLCAALLGVILVLKRYSMIGEGLSNVGFGSLAIALSLEMILPATLQLPSPLLVSLPVVMLAAVLLLRLSENSQIKGDSAIALVSSSSVAIGIVVISLTTGITLDVCNYLFGSILSTTKYDMYISIGVAAVVLVLFVVFYNKIFAVTFDESFARATGTNAGGYNTLIALLTALVIVVGMRIMGAMLISCLVIFPALTSMRVFRSFKSVVVSSALVSLFCFVVGMLVSYIIPVMPSGATIVVVNLAVFIVFSILGKIVRKAGA